MNKLWKKIRPFGRVLKAIQGFIYDLKRFYKYAGWRVDMNNKDIRNYHSVKVYHSLEKSLSQSADIQIRTQEGDVITISFQSLEESSRTAFQLDQGNSQIRTYSENQSAELDFNISAGQEILLSNIVFEYKGK